MTCSTCGRMAHIDFNDRARKCNGCDIAPTRCRCLPTPEPEWVRRAKAGVLVRKDFTGAAA